jgi:peptidoglycan/LPS O-acetylase OafA/YrhL
VRRYLQRRLPLVLLVALGVVAYFCYSLHTTRGSHDRQDTVLGFVLVGTLVALWVYFALRTERLTPQVLGMLAFMAGDVVLYGAADAGREGWTTVSPERQIDGLRACVTVAIVVTVGGVALFEWVQWRQRRKRRAEEAARAKADTTIYQGPDRRGDAPGRRWGDR